jgi:UDP-N-acetylglucosamine acyltransferase
MGGHVQIGDWVQLGGLSAIHQFCQVGAHAFVAGGAILTRDLPPYVMIAGNPAAPHSINSEGLKRRGFSPEQIRNLRIAYRILYRSQLKLAEAIVQLTELAGKNKEVQPLLDFINASTRSLVR